MIMPRIPSKKHTFMNAVAATGVGTTASVKDYRHKVITITAALNSSLTFKFQASNGVSVTSDAEPTFSSAQAVANLWDYVGVYDLESGSFIAGETGVTIDNASVASNTRRYLVNDDHCSYLNIEVTAYTDGQISAVGSFAND